MQQEGETQVGILNNKRKRVSPSPCSSAELVSNPLHDTNKKLKCDPSCQIKDGQQRKRGKEHNDEEEEEASAEETTEQINLYCDSQLSLSQSESECDGSAAPPSSPHSHEDNQTNHQAPDLLVPRSPKKRPLTPQNSSANLDGIIRTNSTVTKSLLNATREILVKKAKPPLKSKEEEEDEKTKKATRRSVGYIHTPLSAEEKLLKAKKQNIQTVLSPEYWRKVCPKLHVQDQDFILKAYSDFASKNYDEDATLSKWKSSMAENGYYETGVLDWGFKVKRLAAAAATLRKLGWHPVWLVMFDEAWLMASCMAGIFRRTVNPKMDFNADFWAWYLDPMQEEKGWEVHRDRFNMPLAESAEPHYCTAWVALTDATPKNGCIYVVPARYDPDYPTLKESTDFDVQNLRALPAPAGTALVWSGRTLHFGGRADRDATVPRIAISFAASTPAFEDPKMRFLFGDRKQDLLFTVNREEYNSTRTGVSIANGKTIDQEREMGKDKEKENKKERENKKEKESSSTSGEGVVVGERRYSFVGRETVSLPGLRTRMGIIATQLWTYEHRIPLPPHIKALLQSLEK